MNAGGPHPQGAAWLQGDKRCNACEGTSPRSLFAAGVQTLVCRGGGAFMNFRFLNPGGMETKAHLRGPAFVKPAATERNSSTPQTKVCTPTTPSMRGAVPVRKMTFTTRMIRCTNFPDEPPLGCHQMEVRPSPRTSYQAFSEIGRRRVPFGQLAQLLVAHQQSAR